MSPSVNALRFAPTMSVGGTLFTTAVRRCSSVSECMNSLAKSSAAANGLNKWGPSNREFAGSAPRKHGVVEIISPALNVKFSDT